MSEPLTLNILRQLGQARNKNPLTGTLPERVFVEVFCPLAALPVGSVRPGAVVAERLALEDSLSALIESGAVTFTEQGYRLTRYGNIVLAVAEAEERVRLQNHR